MGGSVQQGEWKQTTWPWAAAVAVAERLASSKLFAAAAGGPEPGPGVRAVVADAGDDAEKLWQKHCCCESWPLWLLHVPFFPAASSGHRYCCRSVSAADVPGACAGWTPIVGVRGQLASATTCPCRQTSSDPTETEPFVVRRRQSAVRPEVRRGSIAQEVGDDLSLSCLGRLMTAAQNLLPEPMWKECRPRRKRTRHSSWKQPPSAGHCHETMTVRGALE